MTYNKKDLFLARAVAYFTLSCGPMLKEQFLLGKFWSHGREKEE